MFKRDQPVCGSLVWSCCSVLQLFKHSSTVLESESVYSGYYSATAKFEMIYATGDLQLPLIVTTLTLNAQMHGQCAAV